MSGSTFATSYPDLVVVGVRTRSWNEFTKSGPQGPETVPAGSKHYLQVVRRGSLNSVGEILVDGETALEIESHGFGTIVEVQGSPWKEGKETLIRAEAITVTESATVA
jgi:hypothetical protein